MVCLEKSFWTQIEIAAGIKRGAFQLDSVPVCFGNVEFWKDSDEWVYSLPVALWDVESISNDITKEIKKWSVAC